MSNMIQTRRIETDNGGTEFRIINHPTLNGSLHSPTPDQPASVWADGTQLFYNLGLLHREDGQPAVIRGKSRHDLEKQPFEYWEKGQHVADQHQNGIIHFFDNGYKDRMIAIGAMYNAEVGKIRATKSPETPGSSHRKTVAAEAKAGLHPAG